MSNELNEVGTSDDDSSDYDDDDIDNYYNNNEDFAESENDTDNENAKSNNNDVKKLIQELEHFNSKSMSVDATNEFLSNDCEKASRVISISPAMSRLVLQATRWKLAVIKTRVGITAEKLKLLDE
uniref:Uncharacterized protein n=1 Tax=Ciona savignyi TaxID=51511 RepID=H2YY23_CIOSA